MNSPPQVSKRYQEELGEAYFERVQRDAPDRGYALNMEYFEPYLGGVESVLDFGCGTGGMLRLLESRISHAVGVEVNPAAAHAARQAGCTVYDTIEDIPPDISFDLIVSNHVLEHVRDPASTLELLRARLRPGGLFVTKLPIEDIRAPGAKRWKGEDVNHHLHTWTPRLFANTLGEAGFETIECTIVNSAWHPRLFPLARLKLDRLAFRLLAVLGGRRQLLAVGRNPNVRHRGDL